MINVYNDISDKELILLAKLVRNRVDWYHRMKIVNNARYLAYELECKLIAELDRRFPDGWEQDWGA